MTEDEKQEALLELHNEILDILVGVTGIFQRHGLDEVTRFTLIARDPDNDDMCLVHTNDDDLRKATEVALNNATFSVP